MTNQEMYNDIALAKQKLDNTVASGKPSAKERESLKNLLLNNVDGILGALQGGGASETEFVELKEENDALNDALADADRRIAELKAQVQPVTKGGKKE